MEQIATELGVAKGTISKDLAGIVSIGNNSKPAKTKNNPKGSGRPKGSKKPRTNPAVPFRHCARRAPCALPCWSVRHHRPLGILFP